MIQRSTRRLSMEIPSILYKTLVRIGTMLSAGIVGLPNVGKTTLFNALSKKNQEAKNYPFCTIDPNCSIVEIEEPILDELGKLSCSKKIVYPPVAFTDIAGLVEGASKGEGLGNQFLSHIRETGALVHMVRCFEDDDIVHVNGKVDPLHDMEVIDLELMLADIQVLETIHTRLQKQARMKKEAQLELVVVEKMQGHLEKGSPLRSLTLTAEEEELIMHYSLITKKPVIYVANVAENDLISVENPYVKIVKEKADKESSVVIPLCAKIEEELAQLEDPKEFLEELGLKEPALRTLARTAADALGLLTFITTGEMETKAWMIRKGTSAKEAAGAIHSDIEKGFIRAEVISAKKLLTIGSRVKAKELGEMRTEGKEYIVQEGDVILFLHN